MLMFGVTIGFLVWLYMWPRQTSVDFHILLKDGKAHITRPGTTLEVVTDIDNLDETLEHDCSAFGVVMILDFEGAQEIKPDIQTLYQVSMVAKQLQDIQSLIQYYQTYSDTHDEINKLYALEARAKNLLGSIQRTAQIQVYALLAIY